MDRLQEVREWAARQRPVCNILRATLDELQEGFAVVSMYVHPDFCVEGDDGNIMHGGFTTALADTAGVVAAMSVVPSGHTPATSISIGFSGTLREGEMAKAVARVRNITEGQKPRILVDVNVYGSEHAIDYPTPRSPCNIRFAKPKK